ncbi:MAG: hypothetical protein Q8K78_13495 [Planctomycetaceae bacterium]|nr:hypothetical protein [Planctomycetaceae bacterium]
MTDLSASGLAWQVSQVIEFAADLAEVTLPWAESGEAIADSLLFHYWAEGRQLTNDWLRRIELLEGARDRRVALDRDLILATLAKEVFSIEVATRLFSTVLGSLDHVRKSPEYRPIADHALFAIQHVRTRLLAMMLTGDEQHAAADRFRRRCERWTDMLIGPCLVRFGTAAFAHDARRSWEFGEDLLSDAGMDILRQLVRPSLLAAFQGASGRSPIQSPYGRTFLKAMTTIIPTDYTTPRLERWMLPADHSHSEVLPFHQLAMRSEIDAGGWSLLERCLGLVEWRQKRQD